MAGGMNRRGSVERETLAQRIANTRANERDRGAPAPTDTETPPPIRHCWYDGPYGRQAALLVEWRKRAGAWYARIDVALPHPTDGGWCLTELWVDASLVAPVQN